MGVVEGGIKGGLVKKGELNHLEESPHLYRKKTEAQRRDGTCQRSQSQLKMKQGLESKPSVT